MIASLCMESGAATKKGVYVFPMDLQKQLLRNYFIGTHGAIKFDSVQFFNSHFSCILD